MNVDNDLNKFERIEKLCDVILDQISKESD